jgi:hypothetical protein
VSQDHVANGVSVHKCPYKDRSIEPIRHPWYDPLFIANSAFKLDFYAQVQDLSYLLEHLDQSHRTKRYSALNVAICDLIEDFGLVSFETLAVEV